MKTIRRGRYLYFWHYEDRGGRRVQVEEYVGPAGDRRARDDVARRVGAYADAARAKMGQFVRRTQVDMASGP